MKKSLNRVFSLAVLVLAMAGASFAQTSLTQTTLSAALTVGASGNYSGITGSYQTQVSVASATGINLAFNGQPITFLYIDQELFGVLSLAPGQTTIYNVLPRWAAASTVKVPVTGTGRGCGWSGARRRHGRRPVC